MSYKIGMVSLGCSKNLVDAERMLYKIKEANFTITPDPSLADAVIINTCGFIQPAKEEAIDTILEFARLKEEGKIKAIIVTGCLAQRYREEVAGLFPEIDAVIGIGCNDNITDVIADSLRQKRVLQFDCNLNLSLTGGRIISTLPFSSYLKIAEGCDNFCTYCAIPSIRGKYRSVPFEDVIAEARMLAGNGVTEINIIAQDTTLYGYDLYGQYRLPQLLRELCKINEFRWIRLLYCYPDKITDELIETIADEDKIVKYMDIPVQHCCEDILSAMNRKGNETQLRSLFSGIRKKIPEIALRTTLITGFPNESNAHFIALLKFVMDMEFDRLGCFAFSAEEDTPAFLMENQIDEEMCKKRANHIMETQNLISYKKNTEKIGRIMEAVVEGYNKSERRFFGRTAYDAPDIDGKVFFTSDTPISTGRYVKIKITETLDYDLIGDIINESA